MTWGDLITTALKRINVIGAGETPTNDDLSDGFARLKTMLGQWRIQNLTVPYRSRTTWTITSIKGKLGAPYTVGPGGDINVARPPVPSEITVRFQDTSVTPTLEYPLTPLTSDAWERIPQKDLTSPLPTSYYYQPTYSGGLGSLYLWFVPTQSSLQGVFYAPAPLADPVTYTDVIVLPDGYEGALVDNLAVYLFPEYRELVPIDPQLQQAAARSFDLLKRVNVAMLDLTVDPALQPFTAVRYSIYSDSTRG